MLTSFCLGFIWGKVELNMALEDTNFDLRRISLKILTLMHLCLFLLGRPLDISNVVSSVDGLPLSLNGLKK